MGFDEALAEWAATSVTVRDGSFCAAAAVDLLVQGQDDIVGAAALATSQTGAAHHAPSVDDWEAGSQASRAADEAGADDANLTISVSERQRRWLASSCATVFSHLNGRVIEEFMALYVEELSTHVFLAKHTAHCPVCKITIFKDGGCDHMSCGRCRSPFSWETARRLTWPDHEKTPMRHLSHSLRRRHQMLSNVFRGVPSCPACGIKYVHLSASAHVKCHNCGETFCFHCNGAAVKEAPYRFRCRNHPREHFLQAAVAVTKPVLLFNNPARHAKTVTVEPAVLLDVLAAVKPATERAFKDGFRFFAMATSRTGSPLYMDRDSCRHVWNYLCDQPPASGASAGGHRQQQQH